MLKNKRILVIIAGLTLMLFTLFAGGCGESQAEKERKLQEQKIKQFNEEFFKKTPLPKEKAAGMPDFK